MSSAATTSCAPSSEDARPTQLFALANAVVHVTPASVLLKILFPDAPATSKLPFAEEATADHDRAARDGEGDEERDGVGEGELDGVIEADGVAVGETDGVVVTDGVVETDGVVVGEAGGVVAGYVDGASPKPSPKPSAAATSREAATRAILLNAQPTAWGVLRIETPGFTDDMSTDEHLGGGRGGRTRITPASTFRAPLFKQTKLLDSSFKLRVNGQVGT